MTTGAPLRDMTAETVPALIRRSAALHGDREAIVQGEEKVLMGTAIAVAWTR